MDNRVFDSNSSLVWFIRLQSCGAGGTVGVVEMPCRVDPDVPCIFLKSRNKIKAYLGEIHVEKGRKQNGQCCCASCILCWLRRMGRGGDRRQIGNGGILKEIKAWIEKVGRR